MKNVVYFSLILGLCLFTSKVAMAQMDHSKMEMPNQKMKERTPAPQGKTVRYELTATRGVVNLSGKKTVDFALMINGVIPSPTIEFTEGDVAEIVVKNDIPNEELSLHWHGILLPPEMDGVAYVTTPPIASGASYTFRFPLRQSGTYWYHSHTNVQEQKGLYGAIVIHPKKRTLSYDTEVVVVLSDWSDENATDILKNLRKDGDYYAYKKGTIRSWLGAVKAGQLRTFLDNEWARMGGMDLSDVGYDAFLIDGKKDPQLIEAGAGQKIRLRIINASASSYFYVSLGQAPMNVISADGLDIVPTPAKEILMGMAEVYDVLFEMPEGKNYELRVTAQAGTGSVSGWIGVGEKVFAPVKPSPDLYAPMKMPMDHGGMSMKKPMDHGSMKMPMDMPVDILTVDELSSPENTESPKYSKVHAVRLVLDGDMRRYVWHINGKAIHEDRNIVINEGDVVEFTFENRSMMHHPMHLHGHFFRVLNNKREYSPLKHTVDVPPHMTRTIEFLANEPGEWMLHCHNLYHLKTGMARVVKYSSFTPEKEIAHYQKHDPHLHDHRYFYGTAETSSNHALGYFRVSNTWNQLEARIEGRNTTGKNFSSNEPWESEGDLFYRRWVDQYFNVILGGAIFEKDGSGVAGVGYILPFLVESNLLVNNHGKIRLDLDKRLQWTRTVFTDVDFTWRPNQAKDLGTDIEYEVSLMYSPEWSWAAGFMLTNDSIGGGIQVQF